MMQTAKCWPRPSSRNRSAISYYQHQNAKFQATSGYELQSLKILLQKRKKKKTTKLGLSCVQDQTQIFQEIWFGQILDKPCKGLYSCLPTVLTFPKSTVRPILGQAAWRISRTLNIGEMAGLQSAKKCPQKSQMYWKYRDMQVRLLAVSRQKVSLIKQTWRILWRI